MIKKALALLVGILIAVVVVESSTRVLTAVLGMSSYIKYDDRLGWTAEPKTTKHHTNTYLGFDVTYEINENGFRGPSYEAHKPKEIYRVMVLGDSNGFGWGISEDKHFAAIINSQLKNVEVVNLSLSGYSTDQEYLRFLKEGMAYKPDLVIVQVTPNDFEEIQHPFFNQKPKPQFVVAEEGTLELVNVPVRPFGSKANEFYRDSLPLPFKDWLGWHSYAYNYFNEKYYGLKQKLFNDHSVKRNQEWFSDKSVFLFKRIIYELKNKLHEIGAKGIIVHASKDLSDNKYLIDSSLPVLDLYPKFSDYARTTSTEIFYKDGIHWNVEGHRLVAEELIKVIEKYRGP